MTLIGIQTELQANQKSLSDTWTLDNTNYDAETLLGTIVQQGASFEPLYSDPDYFYLMSGLWWKRWKKTFQAWFDVLDMEYNPIENYDRQEQWHEDTLDLGSESTEHSTTTTVDNDTSYSNQGNDKTIEDDDNQLTESGSTKTVTDQDTKNTESGSTGVSGSGTLRAPGNSGSNSQTTTNSVSAYDASTYQPHDQTATTTNRSEDTTSNQTTTHGKIDTGTNDVTETITHGKVLTGTDDKTTTRTYSETGSGANDSTTDVEGTSATDRSNDRDLDHTGRIHGNIGVTTSQQMIESELKLRYWNVYEHIGSIFCKEMLISVY